MRVNERPRSFGLDRTDQLFCLLDVIVADHEGGKRKPSRRTPDIFHIRLIALRVFMNDCAASDLQVYFRDVKGNAAE